MRRRSRQAHRTSGEAHHSPLDSQRQLPATNTALTFTLPSPISTLPRQTTARCQELLAASYSVVTKIEPVVRSSLWPCCGRRASEKNETQPTPAGSSVASMVHSLYHFGQCLDFPSAMLGNRKAPQDQRRMLGTHHLITLFFPHVRAHLCDHRCSPGRYRGCPNFASLPPHRSGVQVFLLQAKPHHCPRNSAMLNWRLASPISNADTNANLPLAACYQRPIL